jgi:small metal-binding protein
MRTQLFLNHRTFMSPLMQHVITALMILSFVIAGCAQHDPYIAAALEHANRAITKGEERDNNALAEQATVALRYAWLAERNRKDLPLQDAIRLLKDGIQHARYGRSDDGVRAVKDAYHVLAEIQ